MIFALLESKSPSIFVKYCSALVRSPMTTRSPARLLLSTSFSNLACATSETLYALASRCRKLVITFRPSSFSSLKDEVPATPSFMMEFRIRAAINTREVTLAYKNTITLECFSGETNEHSCSDMAILNLSNNSSMSLKRRNDPCSSNPVHSFPTLDNLSTSVCRLDNASHPTDGRNADTNFSMRVFSASKRVRNESATSQKLRYAGPNNLILFIM
mmetsp:Transcript_40240/g.85681  ORF Transcript_40240/g.85681 Transcript_40240/m.85681 type:complete len:215 (+) Transcript_40240:948-1592(+)